jgi:hypothetical protein
VAERGESGRPPCEAPVSVQNLALEPVRHDPSQGLAYRDIPTDREVLAYLIDALVEFERLTNPRGDFPGTALKDVLSRDALGKAGGLLARTVRWAVMHQAGLALSKTPASVVPWLPDGSPEWTPEMERASSHEHERRGASWSGTDPTAVRSALATIVEEVLGFWQPARELAEALRALEMGEVRPILMPVKTGMHGPAYALAELKLQALAHVEYRTALLGRQTEALEEVGDALDKHPDTMRKKWRKELPLDEPMCHETLRQARFMGTLMRRLSNRSVLLPQDEERRISILKRFGDEALAELASAFHEAEI